MANTHRDNINAKLKRRMIEYGRWQRWLEETPRWWRKMMNIRPSRRKQARRLNDIVAGVEDDGDWPDFRRPREYYW
jgi:hypothetical protein